MPGEELCVQIQVLNRPTLMNHQKSVGQDGVDAEHRLVKEGVMAGSTSTGWALATSGIFSNAR